MKTRLKNFSYRLDIWDFESDQEGESRYTLLFQLCLIHECHKKLVEPIEFVSSDGTQLGLSWHNGPWIKIEARTDFDWLKGAWIPAYSHRGEVCMLNFARKLDAEKAKNIIIQALDEFDKNISERQIKMKTKSSVPGVYIEEKKPCPAPSEKSPQVTFWDEWAKLCYQRMCSIVDDSLSYAIQSDFSNLCTRYIELGYLDDRQWLEDHEVKVIPSGSSVFVGIPEWIIDWLESTGELKIR